jgi:hypothetical protein
MHETQADHGNDNDNFKHVSEFDHVINFRGDGHS